MYPTLYHAVLDLTGLEWCFLKFLNSFGFFVALAFIAASWTLSLELKRKEGIALLASRPIRIRVGEKARPGDLLSSAIVGFLLGWKGVPILFDGCTVAADAQAFLISLQGNLAGGVIGMVAFCAFQWRTLKRAELPEPREEDAQFHPYQHAGTITLLAALWGFIGAKLFHWLENPDEFLDFVSGPNGKDVFSGLTMYGGLILAGIMVVRFMTKHGIPALVGMDAAAPGLMLAYGIGRIGCQVSGDGDWGIVNRTPAPSWIPDWLWAYDYPNNVIGSGRPIVGADACFPGYCTALDPPVFPTPLYEAIACVLLAVVLWNLRKRLALPGLLFAVYLMMNGIERFLIETIRVNVQVLGSWTQAEIIAVLLFTVGLGGWIWLKRTDHGGPATAD